MRRAERLLEFWRGRFGSLYLRVFLLFLAVCVLFFVGLALFWNMYFQNFFYKDKQEFLKKGYVEVTKLLAPFQEGTLSTRELRMATRIVARGVNGRIFLVDGKGVILNGSTEYETFKLPPTLEKSLGSGLEGKSGFLFDEPPSERRPGDKRPMDTLLTYYAPAQIGGETIVVFLQVPVAEIRQTISVIRLIILLPLLFSLLAVGLLLYFISRRMTAPLKQMNELASAIEQGDLSLRVPVTSKDEVGELAESFNRVVDRLQEWEGTRQEFLAQVSHELRSPLTSLRGLISAMRDGIIEPDKYGHYFRICESEVRRLERLVQELLDLARIQNGAGLRELKPVDMVAQTGEVLDVMREIFARKRLELAERVDVPAGEGLFASLDADRYAQIVHNLLYNAVQFTPEGGAVKVRLERKADKAVLTVSDTGIGMTAEETQRIWEKFHKVDRTRGGTTEGVGLGLTIVKHLVEAMNGRITVQSRPGEGTSFYVEFACISGSGGYPDGKPGDSDSFAG
ncbi:HAMP domain-containing sensor histidine kinase [Paenibacillus chitinolyticus]|uniref:sensor histidine kinase n=1 Tax=Paenibacillus chitinolyticus TaxID=79263 RepID=UPI002DBE20B7|nr:HAMP domain-containing sensor histidine kinase [Paenibacillus chitinolyticus]MEC0248677.1 HAMP domain-containing sensor histidine kinase [Paenibacillus chitinolyticus]